MYKNWFLSAIAILVILFNAGCSKVDTDDSHLQESLQNMLVQHLQAYKKSFPGKTIGFGLYIKGSASGVYASAGFPEEMGENIHFRGASTTKTFTAAAILRLYQEGKLDIDDFITANIPGTNQPYVPATKEYAIPNKDAITIRLLLQHRAGVFDVTNTDIPEETNAPYAGQRYLDYGYETYGEDHTFTFDELMNVDAENQLSYFLPGTDFHYSNSGYHLLAVIIERVTGKRYDQYLQDEFLDPLRMTNTSFPYLGTDRELKAPYLPGWLKIFNEIIEYDKDNLSSAVADGNINTTPADLATWAYALYGTEKIINLKMRNQMLTVSPSHDVNVNYGLGAVHYPEDLGYGHDGVRPAFMTVMRYEPGSNTSFVLFSNFLDFDEVGNQNNDMHEMVRKALHLVKTLR